MISKIILIACVYPAQEVAYIEHKIMHACTSDEDEDLLKHIFMLSDPKCQISATMRHNKLYAQFIYKKFYMGGQAYKFYKSLWKSLCSYIYVYIGVIMIQTWELHNHYIYSLPAWVHDYQTFWSNLYVYFPWSPCGSCQKVYVGQTRWTLDPRLKDLKIALTS